MVVTKKFLMDNRTKQDAWTRSQLQLLGLSWPPKKGWMKLVVGKRLSESEVKEFERCKGLEGKTDIQKLYLSITNRLDELTEGQMVILIDKLNQKLRVKK